MDSIKRVAWERTAYTRIADEILERNADGPKACRVSACSRWMYFRARHISCRNPLHSRLNPKGPKHHSVTSGCSTGGSVPVLPCGQEARDRRRLWTGGKTKVCGRWSQAFKGWWLGPRAPSGGVLAVTGPLQHTHTQDPIRIHFLRFNWTVRGRCLDAPAALTVILNTYWAQVYLAFKVCKLCF